MAAEGQFIVFKRWDDTEIHGNKGPRVVHVGEIAEEYNRITGSIKVLHYIDMGPSDKTVDMAKPLQNRQVYPEYVWKGKSTTLRRGRDKPTKGMELMLQIYKFQGTERINILASNFNIQTGGKIPDGICMKVNQQLDKLQAEIDTSTSRTTVTCDVSHELENYRVAHVISHLPPKEDTETEQRVFGRKYCLTSR